jgi:hypothetical protein
MKVLKQIVKKTFLNFFKIIVHSILKFYIYEICMLFLSTIKKWMPISCALNFSYMAPTINLKICAL